MLHYSALWDWQQPGGIEIHYMDIFLQVHWLLITDIIPHHVHIGSHLAYFF